MLFKRKTIFATILGIVIGLVLGVVINKLIHDFIANNAMEQIESKQMTLEEARQSFPTCTSCHDAVNIPIPMPTIPGSQEAK